MKFGKIFPALKISLIRQIYKRGKIKSHENYRPEAELPGIEKIIEKHAVKLFTKHVIHQIAGIPEREKHWEGDDRIGKLYQF